jgi:hypothetical protein
VLVVRIAPLLLKKLVGLVRNPTALKWGKMTRRLARGQILAMLDESMSEV